MNEAMSRDEREQLGADAECTCIAGGAMFYREFHAKDCPLSVHGAQAPESEASNLQREIAILRAALAAAEETNRIAALKVSEMEARVMELEANDEADGHLIEVVETENDSLRAKLAQAERERDEARLQCSAWHIAFNGSEAMYKALAEQIPADMINADPIAVERVVVAEALAEIGREQIRQLQTQLAERDATIAELERKMGLLCNQNGSLLMEQHDQKQREQRLREAVEFYADQGTWIAVGLLAESPCGAIMSDFSETDDLGEKPGKRAREVLEAVAKPSPSPQGGDAPNRER